MCAKFANCCPLCPRKRDLRTEHLVRTRIQRKLVMRYPEAATIDMDTRELFRADIDDEGITQLSVYCTGDWDAARRAEHAAAVTLIRP